MHDHEYDSDRKSGGKKRKAEEADDEELFAPYADALPERSLPSEEEDTDGEPERLPGTTAAVKRGKKKKGKGFLAVVFAILAVLLLFFFTGNGSSLKGKLHGLFHAGKDGVTQVSASGEPEEVKGMLKLSFIDVGQGDSELIRTPNGKYILIDSGPKESEERLKKYLTSESVSEIEYFVVTHPHSDHMGNAAWVLENYDVRNVILPDVSASGYAYEKLLKSIENEKNEHGCKLLRANPGDFYPVDGCTLTVYGPLYIDREDFNDCSVVLRLVYGDFSALFMGDAGKASEARILGKDYPLKSDVLKVGHHGSSSATSAAFLDAVSPAIAVISCAKNNDYGHPHAETRTALKKRSIPCYVTKDYGTVCLYSDGGDGLYLKTEKDPS